MLSLTFAVGESVMIGDDIMVTVTLIKRGQVRLGFDAPREIAIHREKIYKQIKEKEVQETKKDDPNFNFKE